MIVIIIISKECMEIVVIRKPFAHFTTFSSNGLSPDFPPFSIGCNHRCAAIAWRTCSILQTEDRSRKSDS